MKIIVPLVLLAIVSGCSPKDPPESLLKTQKQTLDKAQEVDELLKATETKRHEQIDNLE